jgi:hypothetical protein
MLGLERRCEEDKGENHRHEHSMHSELDTGIWEMVPKEIKRPSLWIIFAFYSLLC